MLNRTKKEAVLQLRRLLHNNPEPAMQEINTKAILMEFLRNYTNTLEIQDQDSWFYVLKKGDELGEALGFRADYDAVVCGDGVCRHLCGHDGHSAVLAGFALWLDEVRTKRDVYLIFQPGEETGEGGAVCAALVKEKGIGEIYGFHNIPGFPNGEILLREHTFACASTGLEIKLIGKQSHAAYPEMGRNPAGVLARMVHSLEELLSEQYRGVVLGTVIGMEAGGRSYGVSAGEGVLRLTLRAEYLEEYESVLHRVEELAQAYAKEEDIECRITRIEEFPATINTPLCVERLRKAAQFLGYPVSYPKEPFRWSEDFGYYLQQTKGAFFGVGCGVHHAALHTMEYEFEDAIIDGILDLYRKLLRMSEYDRD